MTIFLQEDFPAEISKRDVKNFCTHIDYSGSRIHLYSTHTHVTTQSECSTNGVHFSRYRISLNGIISD